MNNDKIIKKYDLGGDGDLAIDVDKALDEARKDERNACIKHLKDKQPYPEDIFVGNNKKIRAILYEDGTKSAPDGRFGKFGREVWNNAIQALKNMEAIK